LLGGFLAGTAIAQTGTALRLQQPASVLQTGYETSNAGYAVADNQQPGTPAVSPSNQPPPPPTAAATPATPATPAATDQTACEEPCDADKPFKLFQNEWLTEKNIDIRGWVDAGFTWNTDNPHPKYNDPVGYNDRSNELGMNQLYLICERATKTDGCGIDVGGRVDMLYGTDYRYPKVTTGTEFDSEWSTGLYGLAMPQAYGDLAINDLIIRGGHFLAPVGYESVMSAENFFYSHTYSFLYGQPTTFTGGELIYKINDRITCNGGMYSGGWNDFDASNGKVGCFGGMAWNSEDGKTTLTLESTMGNNQAPGVTSTRAYFNVVLTRKLGDKWQYAFEGNYATETHESLATHPTALGKFYDLANYMFYTINDCWKVGLRYEYFSDEDGVVLTTTADGAPTVPGHYSDLGLGLNWKPNATLTVRSEIRWDWADGSPFAAGAHPFDEGKKDQQFLLGTDAIVRF
jgi:hypothetical protein